MANPWLKKNPFMSMWLTGANQVVNSARGSATAAAKRQAVSASSDAARTIFDIWLGAAAATKPSKAQRRR